MYVHRYAFSIDKTANSRKDGFIVINTFYDPVPEHEQNKIKITFNAYFYILTRTNLHGNLHVEDGIDCVTPTTESFKHSNPQFLIPTSSWLSNSNVVNNSELSS